MRTAILKSTGREYLIGSSVETGSEEENNERRNAGKGYYTIYNTTIYYCNILKNGKPFGSTRIFHKDQLEKITEL